MNYLSPISVADRLRAKKLSERAQFGYLLASVVVVGLARAADKLGVVRHPAPLYAVAVVFVVSMLGVWLCFRINARGDNREFVVRYVCLRLPAVFAVAVVVAPVWVIAYLLMRRFTDAATARLTFATMAPYLAIAAEVITIWIMVTAFRRILR